MSLLGYARSLFRDFQSYLRNVVGLNEYDTRLKLREFNSNFVTYEKHPGVNSIKVISEAVCTMGDHEGTLKIEYDGISIKQNLFQNVLVELSER